ncbi:TPA: NTF2 fold immunity protein [Morganella morganii]
MNIDAKKVLVDFISAMNSWELTYYPLVRDNGMLSIKDKMGGDLNEIFDTFCTKKERKQGRQVALSCTEPPTYAPEEEITGQDESRGKVTIYTQQHTGLKNKYRYTLLLKNGVYLLDKKERFSDYENKWVKDNL